MITQDEINDAAKKLDLHTANLERDYVFGWIISGLFQESSLASSLVLKGDDALRKAYFPLTRFSDDIDFSTAGDLDVTVLLNELITYGRVNRVMTLATSPLQATDVRSH